MNTPQKEPAMNVFLSPRRFAVFLIALLSLSLTLTGCSKPPYERVDNAGLQALIDQGMPLYDIRRPDEWRQTGVVEGSQKLTFVDASGRVNPSFLADFTARVGKNDPVVLICRTGSRTDALARELMEKHGYTKVYNVTNGITRWISEGNPVVRN
jgi:rhodanese-related sulfurtransferase